MNAPQHGPANAASPARERAARGRLSHYAPCSRFELVFAIIARQGAKTGATSFSYAHSSLTS